MAGALASAVGVARGLARGGDRLGRELLRQARPLAAAAGEAGEAGGGGPGLGGRAPGQGASPLGDRSKAFEEQWARQQEAERLAKLQAAGTSAGEGEAKETAAAGDEVEARKRRVADRVLARFEGSQDAKALADILETHGVLVKGGPDASRQFLADLLHWKQGT